MISIEDLMERVEKRRNPYFYDHISGYEVQYREKTESWWLRKILDSGKYGGNWASFNKESYIKIFTALEIDMFAFQAELHRSCLTEAVYHKMIYDNIRKALGDEAVDAAEADFKAFGEALVGVIGKVVRRKNIKLV